MTRRGQPFQSRRERDKRRQGMLRVVCVHDARFNRHVNDARLCMRWNALRDSCGVAACRVDGGGGWGLVVGDSDRASRFFGGGDALDTAAEAEARPEEPTSYCACFCCVWLALLTWPLRSVRSWRLGAAGGTHAQCAVHTGKCGEMRLCCSAKRCSCIGIKGAAAGWFVHSIQFDTVHGSTCVSQLAESLGTGATQFPTPSSPSYYADILCVFFLLRAVFKCAFVRVSRVVGASLGAC